MSHISDYEVLLTPRARHDFDRLDRPLQARVAALFVRLRGWPLAGAKPLSADWAGHFRFRVGFLRVVIRLEKRSVVVVRIGNRSEVYDG